MICLTFALHKQEKIFFYYDFRIPKHIYHIWKANNCHPQPSECFYGEPIKKAFMVKL